MDFLRKHYEKVLLSIVLLCLAGLAAVLPFSLEAVQGNIDSQQRYNPRIFTPDDTTAGIAGLLAEDRKMAQVRLSDGEHNLFNPVGWMPTDRGLVKDPLYRRRGVSAFEITSIHPLFFMVAFREEHVDSDGDISYSFDVTRQAHRKKSMRRASRRQCELGGDNEIFALLEVKGSPREPSGFVLQLQEDQRRIEVGRNEPFREVVGHAADLIYPPKPGLKFRDRRRNETVTIDGREYMVVVVTEDEVMLRDERTRNQSVIRIGESPEDPG